MKKYLLSSALLLLIGPLHAATITAQNSDTHRWNDANTWVGGVFPTDGDIVVIPAGVVVNTMEDGGDPGTDITYQILSVDISQITVAGTLQLGDPNQTLGFGFKYSVNIIVQNNGRLVDTTDQDEFNTEHPDYHDFLFQNDSHIHLLNGATFKTQNPTYIYATNETVDGYPPSPGNQPYNDINGPFTIDIVDGTVPVKLYDLFGQYDAGAISLHWKTASEQNNAYFEVQRSTDGTTFIPIGKIPGAGTSAVEHDYSYTDYGVSKMGTALLFYRIRQVDIDGKSTYYGIVKITPWHEDASLRLWPNPSSGRFMLSLGKVPEKAVTVSIFNLNGQLISRLQVQEPRYSIDLSGQPAGVYLVQLNYRDGHQQVLRAVIN